MRRSLPIAIVLMFGLGSLVKAGVAPLGGIPGQLLRDGRRVHPPCQHG